MVRLIVELVFAIIGGAIMVALYIGNLEGRLEALEGKEERIVEARKKALKEISTKKEEALAAVQKTLEQKPKTWFGNWDMIEVNRVYQAKSDGFVTAYTHSNDRTALSIRIGESEANLGRQNTRSKGSHGNGTVVPVRNGQYYLVNADAGSPNFVEAYWLPIER